MFHRLAGNRDEIEPEQHGPQAVLFADVIRAGAIALFPAEGDFAGIEQVAEKLPAGGGLVAGDAQGCGDAIDRGRGGHGARHTGQPAGIARNALGVRRQHGEAVGRRDHEVAADDHVAVGVAVGGGAHIGGVGRGHVIDQVGGVDRVGVGVQIAEVFARFGVDHGALGCAELAFEQGFGIGTAHRPHGVQPQAEAAGEQGANGVEIEQLALHRAIVGHRVDDLDLRAQQGVGAESVQRQVGAVHRADFIHLARTQVDGFCDRLGRGAAVGDVVFDAEVALRPAGVVAGRQHDAAAGRPAANDRAHRRGGQQSSLPHQHPRVALRRRHAQDGLDGDAVVVAPVAAHDQGLAAGVPQHVEQGLHKVFEIAGLLEHADFFAQP